jgi:protein-disulfide isomerase/uncharacterized membrane protein
VFRVLVVLLLSAGMALSIYLSLRRLELLAGGESGLDICGEYLGGGCDDALKSPSSVQLGVSLPGWGLVYYGTLVCLLVMGWGLGEQFRAEAGVLGLIATTAAAVASMLLLSLMAAGAAPWCALCAATHGINLALVAVWPKAVGTSLAELRSAVASAARFLVSGAAPNLRELRWRLTALLVPPLVAAALFQWVFIEERLLNPPLEQAFDPQQIVAEFEAAPRHEIPVDQTDPMLGPADAPLQLVVFSDFQCPVCRRFAVYLRELADRRGDELQVVFKHWPLGTDCNPALKRNLHPRACRAALAAESARRQNKFWCYHDALIAAPRWEAGDEYFKKLARDCGLDGEQFDAALDDAATAEKVQADVLLGTQLGVNGTPTLFLNGRRLPDYREQTIELLLAHELAESAPKHAE